MTTFFLTETHQQTFTETMTRYGIPYGIYGQRQSAVLYLLTGMEGVWREIQPHYQSPLPDLDFFRILLKTYGLSQTETLFVKLAGSIIYRHQTMFDLKPIDFFWLLDNAHHTYLITALTLLKQGFPEEPPWKTPLPEETVQAALLSAKDSIETYAASRALALIEGQEDAENPQALLSTRQAIDRVLLSSHTIQGALTSAMEDIDAYIELDEHEVDLTALDSAKTHLRQALTILGTLSREGRKETQ